MNAPAASPCGSCPYRRDVPSGVWDESEYEKLPGYDNPTPYQPTAVFLCHQQDGRICSGWAGCHDMGHSLGLRLAAALGELSGEDLERTLDHTTSVPLFGSGREARDHGMAELERPGERARSVIGKLEERRGRGRIRGRR